MSKISHRQSTKSVTLTDKSGAPVKNREVTVKQTKQEFMFGCAEFGLVQYVNGELSGKELELAENSTNKALNLFNFITLPFYWGRFEPVRGEIDTVRIMKTAEWLQNKGKMVKGHPLCWHTVCAPWLLEMTNEDILKTQLGRIQRDVSGFAGIIDTWDVINEVVIMPIFDKYDNGVTRICKELGRIELVKRVFAEAKAANPKATLLINDFDMSESYDILIEGLLAAGVPIDVIGLQSHMHQGAWSDEKTAEILERFSRFKLPLHFTEINMVSGDLMPKHIVDLNDFQVIEWPTTSEGEARQAKDAVNFYKMLYEHPSVEAITWWSFTDGGWLNAPAGFITSDGRAKSIYDEMDKLINGNWRTPDSKVMTDENGTLQLSGFKGDYTVEFDGNTWRFSL
jgi:GH35 family endo-1,4-beta-xylanase